MTVDRTKVDYGALMLGAALKETFHIVNREAMPHSFVFDKSSLGMAQVLFLLCCLFFAISSADRNMPDCNTLVFGLDHTGRCPGQMIQTSWWWRQARLNKGKKRQPIVLS